MDNPSEWLKEIQLTRRGGNEDYRHWNKECRKNWARVMIDLAKEHWGEIPEGDKKWLNSMV